MTRRAGYSKAVCSIAVTLLLGLAACSSSSSDPPAAVAGPPAPSDAQARAEHAGVPYSGSEQIVTHTHTQLDVVVDGNTVTVPAGIGIAADGSGIATLHTHDDSGLIHVESPNENDSYTLGQALQMWGIEPNDAAVCAAFGVAAGCSVTVTLAHGSAKGYDTVLAENDTLTLTLASP